MQYIGQLNGIRALIHVVRSNANETIQSLLLHGPVKDDNSFDGLTEPEAETQMNEMFGCALCGSSTCYAFECD